LRTYEKTEIKRTAFRVRGEITKELGEGLDVTVLTIVPGTMQYRGLPVDSIAGLEVGLIRKIQPKWNIRELGAFRKAEAMAKRTK
jgi:hypothetical protein